MIVIAGLPPSLNKWSRMHYRTRMQASKLWADRVWVAAKNARAPTLDVPAVVSLTFWNPRAIDPDNYAKFVMDGIVKAKLIRDDRFPYLYELRLRNRIGFPARVEVLIERAEAQEGDPALYRAALDAMRGPLGSEP